MGAGLAKWWERSPPTNVARVRFPDPPSYVGWVCCWFSTLLREDFLLVLRFPPLTTISKFQFDSGMQGHFWTSSCNCELLSAPWVNKLHFSYFIFCKGLQVITRVYKCLQGITRVYRGLQGNTRGATLKLGNRKAECGTGIRNRRLWAQNVTHTMIGKSHDNKQNFVMRPKRLATTESPRHGDSCKQNLLKRSNEMFD